MKIIISSPITVVVLRPEDKKAFLAIAIACIIIGSLVTLLILLDVFGLNGGGGG